MEPPYVLVIGSRNYSSWSLRGWLLLKLTGAPFEVVSTSIYQPDSRDRVRALGGETGLVPLLVRGGQPIWDTWAILETLAEAHPHLWPRATADRARARSYCGEIHGGLAAVRAAMPTNVRGRDRAWTATSETSAEIARVAEIWRRAEQTDGPWLFGPDLCAADALFAPVACRFRTYGVAPAGAAGRYMAALLDHPWMREWSEAAEAEALTIGQFEHPPRAARATREVWL